MNDELQSGFLLSQIWSKLLSVFNKFKISHIKYWLISLFLIAMTLFIVLYLVFHDPDFYTETLPSSMKNHLINSNKWSEQCGGVPLERMRLVNVKFYQEKQKIDKNGSLIVLDVVAENVINIFKKLYKNKVIISSVKTINYYDNYEMSYKNNNVISFFCDAEMQEKYPNLTYQYGTAIDLNPIYNPKIEINQSGSNQVVLTTNILSVSFINRNILNDFSNEKFVKIFAQNGFSQWGGNFNATQKIIAYNYFGLNKFINDLLLVMNFEDGKIFLKIISKNYKVVNRIDKMEYFIQFKKFYLKDSKKFFKILNSNIGKLKNMEDSEFFNLLNQKFE